MRSESDLHGDAVHALKRGAEYAYDHSGDGPPPPATDWAHAAARGVLYDLSDRRGIKWALRDVDADVRPYIVLALAEIIRVGAETVQSPAADPRQS